MAATPGLAQDNIVIANIDIGTSDDGNTALVDLEELLATRLLVQGNSGSGKSHLLRRILEGSAGLVQQIVIDPEGDFVSLAEAFSHIAVEAADHSLPEIASIAARIRAHRASVVLNLEGLEMEDQMRCVATFLGGLFDAPRDHWYPALVVVDEAQVFAPAAAGEISEDARRASLSAMTNLMCRGRKRGLAGIIATQRLAKLAKNVAAEASNFLMGRTFLDIDMARAADLLGMERRQAETIRDLARGEFLALGPAIARRPVRVRVGAVQTGSRAVSPKLMPLPQASDGPIADLIFAPIEEAGPPPPPVARPTSEDLIRAIATPASVPDLPTLSDEERDEALTEVFAELAATDDGRDAAGLYQDFQLRCRMRGIADPTPLRDFRRRYALMRAGISDATEWEEAIALAQSLPEEMLAPFLAIARAARDGEASPTDEQLARLYGTQSAGRARRMLTFIEESGLIVIRTDLAGKRSIALPHLGWTTAGSLADPSRPPRLARIDAREQRRAAGR